MKQCLSQKPECKKPVLFCIGFFTGICCFLITYGTRVLDVTYDSWIFSQESPDIKQHYLGCCHFIRSPWSFPLGMIDSLSYPWKMSIVWTDSIPGVCIVFKLLRNFLPETFQFFGWYGLLTFALTGGIAALLVKKLTDRSLIALLTVPFFVLTFPMLQRMYYHTSLASQWILLLAFLLWFSRDFSSPRLKNRCISWGLMGLLCVMIHPYFLPMVGFIILAESLEYYIRCHEFKASIACIISFCAAAVFALWSLGAFSSKVDNQGYAAGGFNANLNTFINSCGKGLLPGLSLKYPTQSEGYCYLGLGILLLLLISAVMLFRTHLLKKRTFHELFRLHPRAAVLILLFAVQLIAAVFPEADLGTVTIIPDFMPHSLKVLLGVFRSNGRFIWSAMYILMFSSIAVCCRLLKGRKALAVIIVCLILQAADLSPYAAERHRLFTGDTSYGCILDTPEINYAMGNYRHIVLTFDNNDLIMNCSYYAYLHGKTMNRFYFARDIDDQTEEQLAKYLTDARAGHPAGDCLFIMDEDTMDEWSSAGLNFYRYGNLILGSAEPISGLEKY